MQIAIEEVCNKYVVQSVYFTLTVNGKTFQMFYAIADFNKVYPGYL
jgi:hypothetical protein